MRFTHQQRQERPSQKFEPRRKARVEEEGLDEEGGGWGGGRDDGVREGRGRVGVESCLPTADRR